MKRGTLSSIVKKVAITTFALAAIFTFNVTAVSASEVEMPTQELSRSGGRASTERESRILLPRGVRSDVDNELNRTEGRTGTERESRILLPSGIRSDADNELNRTGGRTGTERESRILLPRGFRNGTDTERGLREEILCVREQMDEMGFERSNTRNRSERESRSVRGRLAA